MFCDKMLFKWYQGPLIADILTKGFERNNFEVVFAESEIVRQDYPNMPSRQPNVSRVDFEAKNQGIFFGCEIKVGWSKNRKKIGMSDPHAGQFRKQAEKMVDIASNFNLKPHYSIALGCKISDELLQSIQSICKHSSVVVFRPNEEDSSSFPIIKEVIGSDIDVCLINAINDVSKERWNTYKNWNNIIKGLALKANTPRDVFNHFVKNELKRNPKDVIWQNLFSSQFKHNEW